MSNNRKSLKLRTDAIALPADGEPPLVFDAAFKEEFVEKMRAGFQIIHICTTEEGRCEKAIRYIASEMKLPVVSWDMFIGYSQPEEVTGNNAINFREPSAALAALINEENRPFYNENGLFIFKDLDETFSSALIRRAIRSLYQRGDLVGEGHSRPMILLSTKAELPIGIRDIAATIEFQLPSQPQLDEGVVEFLRNSTERKNPAKAVLSDELREGLLQDLLGMTSDQAENATAAALIHCDGFKPEMRALLKREKANVIKSGGVLTYVDVKDLPTRDEIGGYVDFFEAMDMQKKSYSKRAEALGLDTPRGIVLLGVPGTGKSVVARVAASIMELPLYVLDVGSIFKGVVGDSEATMRRVQQQVNAQKGCVLLVDEADKAFGHANSAQGDSGVTRRLFGSFLTWLGDRPRRDRTFVIMTMNRTDGMPPEFLRAGRFDAIWATDLPEADERRQIMEIHFKKRGLDPSKLGFTAADWAVVTKATKDYVGSELEQVVRTSMVMALQTESIKTLADGTEMLSVTTKHMCEAAGTFKPMITVAKKEIDEIRNFCNERAMPVQAKRQRSAAAVVGRTGRGLDV